MHMVGTQSLRDRDYMDLKILGKSNTAIMKFDRWSSLTFLQYIRAQITPDQRCFNGNAQSTPLS